MKFGKKLSRNLLIFSVSMLITFTLLVQLPIRNVNYKILETPRSINPINIESKHVIENWNTTWGGPLFEFCNGVEVDASGLYISGGTDSFGAGTGDIFLVKYDIKGVKQWQTFWGSNFALEYGNNMAMDSSGIYIAGETNSTGQMDALLVKFANNSTALWNITWGYADLDTALDVAVDSSGIYITGKTNKSGNYDAFLAKFDIDGTQKWNTTWGGIGDDMALGVEVDGSGVYITGETHSFGIGGDAFLAKYAKDGTFLWNYTLGDTGNERANGLAVDSSGVYFVGSTDSWSGGDQNGFIFKCGINGELLWDCVVWFDENDSFSDVAVDSSGIYIIGSTNSSGTGNFDAYLMKLDIFGGWLWETSWDGGYADNGYGITVDGSGVYIVGNSEVAGQGYDAFLCQYKPNLFPKTCFEEWKNFFGKDKNDTATGVAVDSTGVYIVGNTDSFSATNGDIFLVNYDIYGCFNWSALWISPGSDRAFDLAVGGAGIYIVGGSNSSGNGDILLVKYDVNSTLVWNTTWGGSNFDMGYSIAVDSSGVYLAGETAVSIADTDAVLLKYDKNGTIIWNKTWGRTGMEFGLGVDLDGSGIYLAGTTSSFGIHNKAFLVKYDINGTEVWNTTWGGTLSDAGYDLVVDGSGIYIVGETQSFDPSIDAFIARYDPNGTLIWNVTCGGEKEDKGMGVAVDGSGIFLVGETNSYDKGNGDLFLTKYNINGSQEWIITWNNYLQDIGAAVAIDGSGIYVAGSTDWGGGDVDALIIHYYEGQVHFRQGFFPPLLLPEEDTTFIIILALIIVGAVAASTSVVVLRRKRRVVTGKVSVTKKGMKKSEKLASQTGYVGVSDMTLDVKIRNLIKSETPIESIEDENILNFLEQEFNILSKNEITRILQLDIPQFAEKIIILEELARLPEDKREEFIKSLENIKENF